MASPGIRCQAAERRRPGREAAHLAHPEWQSMAGPAGQAPLRPGPTGAKHSRLSPSSRASTTASPSGKAGTPAPSLPGILLSRRGRQLMEKEWGYRAHGVAGQAALNFPSSCRLEDSPRHRNGQHGRSQTGRVHFPDRTALCGDLRGSRLAPGGGQYRNRGWTSGRDDRQPPGNRQSRLYRLDRGRTENSRGHCRTRQGTHPRTRREVPLPRFRRRRFGRRRAGGRHLVQPGTSLLRRIAPLRSGRGGRRLSSQAESPHGQAPGG